MKAAVGESKVAAVPTERRLDVVGWVGVVLTIITLLGTAGIKLDERLQRMEIQQASSDAKLDTIMEALHLTPSRHSTAPTDASMHKER